MWSAIFTGMVLSGLAGGWGCWRLFRRGRPARNCAAGLLAVVVMLVVACGGAGLWARHRPQPRPVEAQTLFQGVTYSSRTLDEPRPCVVHVVEVELHAAGVEPFVTPSQPTGGRALAASTVSQCLVEHRLQLAVNGGFFHPWHAAWLLDYYPHVGDPVDVHGLAIAEGARYGHADPAYPTLWIGEDRLARIGPVQADARWAISGRPLLVINGQVNPAIGRDLQADLPNPRTALGINAAGDRLLIFVVDGRQPVYSEGLTLPELAELMIDQGCHAGVNLDGGGSTTLVVADERGRPRVINSPIHGRFPPGIERPVANHLGFRARPIPR